jgi:putative membrane protein
MTRGAGAWGITFIVVLLWSAVAPHDRFTWWLEVFPALGGAIALALTRSRHPLTPLLYGLLLLHCIVLMVGGHYTYAHVPLFDWIRPVFGFERNHYDRLGHLMQGFAPAMLAREILLRGKVVSRGGWLWLFVAVCGPDLSGL